MDSDTVLLLVGLALLVIAAVLLVSMVPSPAERAAFQVRQFSASLDKVFDATVAYVQDLGYVIDSLDRANGLIKTEYASRGQLYGGAGVVADLIAKARYAATVQIRELTPGVCTVRVNLVVETWNEGSLFRSGYWEQDAIVSSIKASYDDFFEGLEKALGIARTSLLGTRPTLATA